LFDAGRKAGQTEGRENETDASPHLWGQGMQANDDDVVPVISHMPGGF
jgi:hypothetical protein